MSWFDDPGAPPRTVEEFVRGGYLDEAIVISNRADGRSTTEAELAEERQGFLDAAREDEERER